MVCSRFHSHEGALIFSANEYTGYNFGHDEWDYSTQQFRKYLWARNPNTYRRMPTSFGPMPGPRLDFEGNTRDGANATFTTASIKFKTSRTVLQNLFATSEFKFSSPATLTHATFSVTTLGNLDWLGGRGYSHFGLYIHGVEYCGKYGKTLRGSYLPILFENLADPILSGRDELGMPKVWSDLNIQSGEEKQDWSMQASWHESKFCKMRIDGLEVTQDQNKPSLSSPPEDQGLLWHKEIPQTRPASSMPRQADVTYTVLLPDVEEARVKKQVMKSWKGKGTIRFDKLDWKALPTLHHIVARLEEIPVYEVLEAKVVHGKGMSDVRSAQRVE